MKKTTKKNTQPTKSVAKKPKEKVENNLFKIAIKLGNVLLSGEGLTALEEIRSITVPNKITTKGILTISQGEKKKELVYTIPKLKRLFYPNAQPILIKYLAMLMK